MDQRVAGEAGSDVTLGFPGGSVSTHIPTRAALLKSAKEWVIMSYESTELIADATKCDSVMFEETMADIGRAAKRQLAQLERVEKILDELSGMEEK